MSSRQFSLRTRSAARDVFRRSRAPGFAMALAWAMALPRAAFAYCPTYTCEFDGSEVCDIDLETGCRTGGKPARWASNCISYAVESSGSSDEAISAEGLSEVLADGFRAWSDAACPGADGSASGLTPPLVAVDRGQTSCDSVEYNCGASDANLNIVMFRDGESDLSSNTIALSTIIANLVTGEILDVDIEINSRDFDFRIEPSRGRRETQDLRLVLNHELGHLLGLSHTRVDGALMRPEYDGESALPAADDVRGMCDVLSMASTDPSCPALADATDQCLGEDSLCPVAIEADSGGCALGSIAGSSAPRSPWLWLSALGIMGSLRRRRAALLERDRG